ncbi:hypothetical protein M3Y95_01008000 [Aphelenchoides besseyi]|nr:hypothetical protein M3Y95_01008000 [Aphelenchoides besseyi]
MRASIVLLGLVGALAMLEMGWALKCYEGDCPSIDENCKYEIKECLPQEDACYTEKISDEGNQTIHKNCRQAIGIGCKTFTNGDDCDCYGNLCNTQYMSYHQICSGNSCTTTFPSLVLFLVLLLVFV